MGASVRRDGTLTENGVLADAAVFGKRQGRYEKAMLFILFRVRSTLQEDSGEAATMPTIENQHSMRLFRTTACADQLPPLCGNEEVVRPAIGWLEYGSAERQPRAMAKRLP